MHIYNNNTNTFNCIANTYTLAWLGRRTKMLPFRGSKFQVYQTNSHKFSNYALQLAVWESCVGVYNFARETKQTKTFLGDKLYNIVYKCCCCDLSSTLFIYWNICRTRITVEQSKAHEITIELVNAFSFAVFHQFLQHISHPFFIFIPLAYT